MRWTIPLFALLSFTPSCGLAEPTPLMDAVVSRDPQKVQSLLDSGADPDDGGLGTPLVEAARSGDVDILRILMRGGAKIDFDDGVGWTALVAAGWAGSESAAKFLVDSGANVCIRTTSEIDWAPNMYASEVASTAGHNDLSSYLRDRQSRCPR